MRCKATHYQTTPLHHSLVQKQWRDSRQHVPTYTQAGTTQWKWVQQRAELTSSVCNTRIIHPSRGASATTSGGAQPCLPHTQDPSTVA